MHFPFAILMSDMWEAFQRPNAAAKTGNRRARRRCKTVPCQLGVRWDGESIAFCVFVFLFMYFLFIFFVFSSNYQFKEVSLKSMLHSSLCFCVKMFYLSTLCVAPHNHSCVCLESNSTVTQRVLQNRKKKKQFILYLVLLCFKFFLLYQSIPSLKPFPHEQ